MPPALREFREGSLFLCIVIAYDVLGFTVPEVSSILYAALGSNVWL